MHARQLLAWERAGLITSSEHYSFEALSQLRKLRDLQATTRISAKSIRASVDAMQRVAGMRNPLMEASFVRRGSRLSFRHGGALMDPLTQQLAFDFDTSPARQLRVVGAGADAPARQAAEVQDMFLRAVQLEENPATIPQAMEIYQTILAIRPEHAPALINSERSTTTFASTSRPSSTTARRPSPTPSMRSRSSIWAMCSTRCSG